MTAASGARLGWPHSDHGIMGYSGAKPYDALISRC